MIFFLYLACLLLLLYYFTTKRGSYWEIRNIPHEKPFLFFGSFFPVVTRKEHIFHIVRRIYNKYSTPYVGIHVFHRPYLLIRDPKLLKKVLVKDFDKFINRSVTTDEKIDPLSFHGLFAAKDLTWKNIRAKVSPVFTSGKMKLMFPLMKACAKDLSDYFSRHNGETIDTRSVTKKYSVDIISSCAFGINAYCLKHEDSEMMKMATQLLDFRSLKRSISTFSFFFMPPLVKIFKLTFGDRPAADYLINVFTEGMKERQEKKIVRHDLIDLLDNLKKNEQFNEVYKFDDIKMAALAITFFAAGNDTTSIMISFTLYELALHKEMQDRLREEVRESFEKNNGDFTYESIQEMKYLDMVFSEALRKYPLTTFLNREAATDYTFEETGFTLEKGVPIMIPVVGLHYDPEYFPNPDKFDPERFNDENKNNIQPYTYMPFGEGPRNCIGQRFGLLVSKIGLAYSIKNFVFDVAEETTIPLHFNPGSIFLQNKGGVYLKVTKI